MVGTERHESRRIDNQLRGRTARCASRPPPPSDRGGGAEGHAARLMVICLLRAGGRPQIAVRRRPHVPTLPALPPGCAAAVARLRCVRFPVALSPQISATRAKLKLPCEGAPASGCWKALFSQPAVHRTFCYTPDCLSCGRSAVVVVKRQRGRRRRRQGDPGSTRYFLSLEDNLFRIFGGDRIKGMMSAFQARSPPPRSPSPHDISSFPLRPLGLPGLRCGAAINQPDKSSRMHTSAAVPPSAPAHCCPPACKPGRTACPDALRCARSSQRHALPPAFTAFRPWSLSSC